jgi:hypothetical protein
VLQTDNSPSHITHHINLNLLYLEAQDNGPYQAKNEPRVSINNVFCTDTFQSNLNKGTATVSKLHGPDNTAPHLHLLFVSTTVTGNELIVCCPIHA